ncbi:threonine aldolase [Brevundimonas nasdae]|uniref:threonine aldolase family protein n=1 Tax=Brevundimonas nasdae TaxID=172043 RepID=UPI00191204D0|nr:beta-eliminating lyase-related protein [Brevundimonas nasdae]MBK6026384.1 low specificity L-threonine aldolase [Brevundimonas nasdae]MDQ0453136.1 threonine aldolase [Brevundimonas nasdae]
MRYDFGSDNTAGMAPSAVEGLIRANSGHVPAYGRDEITERAADQIRQRVDADAEVRFVFSGTAANAIALSMLAFPFEAVLAHNAAHVCTDETGAPGFFGQGVGLIGLPGFSGRIDPLALRAQLAEPEVAHRQPPAALSVTQATEYGTVYTEEELRQLIEPVKALGYGVHMDGARLANAAAAGFDLKDIPRLGVDILVFGGAKAGANCAEAVVLFDKSLARRFDNRLKQAGQVASKARLLAGPMLGLLESGDWESGGAHANLMARRLADGIVTRSRFVLAHPVESNAVFVRMSDDAHARLNAAGWACYQFDDGSVRFVCSWATTEEVVDELLEAISAIS